MPAADTPCGSTRYAKKRRLLRKRRVQMRVMKDLIVERGLSHTLQQEMIDEMIAVIAGMIAAVIVEMIVVVIVEMILHRSRLPNVIKVGRKPPMVGMVGLQFLKNENY